MADNRKSVADLRTSSGTNAGPDKDSEKRQRSAIQRYCKRAGITVVEWFNDPAVSGADPIEARPGFAALLDRIEGNGVTIVLVEDASRFARDLVAQELGLLMLIKRGVRVLTAASDDMTDTSDPSRIMMRQIAGSFAQYEKARLVHKLKAARDRKKALTGKCGGRKPLAEARPEVAALAREMHGQRMSLRKISAALAEQGHLTGGGRPYSPNAVQAMTNPSTRPFRSRRGQRPMKRGPR
jgi:DNA invertase Pin-like site-specific DNA recombinase